MKDKDFAILVAVLVLLAILIAIVLLLFTLEPESEKLCKGEIGGYCYGDPATVIWIGESAPTSVELILPSRVELPPIKLELVLENSTNKGTYIFPSNDNGTDLVLVSGDAMGTMRYIDLADNGRINLGDSIIMDGLGPGSYYTFRLVYIPSDTTRCFYCFETPEG